MNKPIETTYEFKFVRNVVRCTACLILTALSCFLLQTTPSERRFPGRCSFIGGGNFAYDARQGELDYDPFAYDVASLGQLFCEAIQVRSLRMKTLRQVINATHISISHLWSLS